MIMSAALALSEIVPVALKIAEKRPALNLVQVAEQPSAQLKSARLQKRFAMRSRLSGVVASAANLALFHAYRP
jgi:predicted RNase H-like nuclease (RuvC/YqgF family)